jgi:hypothetical protein
VETSIEQWIFDGLALAVLFQQIIECLDRQGRSRSSVDAGRATSEPLDAHGSNARSRSRRGNSLADHFFIFKAAPSKVVTMACISPSLVM